MRHLVLISLFMSSCFALDNPYASFPVEAPQQHEPPSVVPSAYKHTLAELNEEQKVLNDIKESRTLYKSTLKRAKAGDRQAQHLLGLQYAEGTDGVLQNQKRARKWFRRAARQDLPESAYRLGVMYWNGEGGEEDVETARSYLERAVQAGGIEAAELLEEDGLLSALEDEADCGDTNARVKLAQLLANAKHLEPNYEESISHLEEAAKTGSLDALLNLGHLYFRGQLVEQDLEKAFYYFLKGAELGSPLLQQLAGILYFTGTGCIMSLDEAQKWFERS